MWQYVELSRKLTDLGYVMDRHTYDCGERITVREGGRIIASLSSDCGDAVSASDQIATLFDERGWPHASTHTSE